MKRFGLIGKPLSHSFSQKWFTEKFQREGLKAHRYDHYELDTIEEFPDLISSTKGLVGLNVTVPYKQTVIPFLDAVDPMALAVGAVNTIHIENGRTTGYNTDVLGFRSTLLPLLNGKKPRALVLGSGGASRAVAFVLRDLGIKFRVVGRTREKGDLTWDLLDPILVAVSPLIINTTPLGMFPAVDSFPALPYASLGEKHVVIDLVYNPVETVFLKKARLQGAITANGMHMLHTQAEESWGIWVKG